MRIILNWVTDQVVIKVIHRIFTLRICTAVDKVWRAVKVPMEGTYGAYLERLFHVKHITTGCLYSTLTDHKKDAKPRVCPNRLSENL